MSEKKPKRRPPPPPQKPEPRLPDPAYFGRERRYPLSAILRYEAEVQGKPPPEPLGVDEERWLCVSEVLRRFGVSNMWLNRRHRRNAATNAAPTQAAEADTTAA
jgi:hypothetical protein